MLSVFLLLLIASTQALLGEQGTAFRIKRDDKFSLSLVFGISRASLIEKLKNGTNLFDLMNSVSYSHVLRGPNNFTDSHSMTDSAKLGDNPNASSSEFSGAGIINGTNVAIAATNVTILTKDSGSTGKAEVLNRAYVIVIGDKSIGESDAQAAVGPVQAPTNSTTSKP